jgi:hypothetical protein
MDNIDLNIDNYDMHDIIKLFNISINFDLEDLKRSKKIVLLTHPDKSNLDKEYFLFFSKAYKILLSIYNFREKSKLNNDFKNKKIEYLLPEEDVNNKEIIKKLEKFNKFSHEEFNKWFNNLFNKVNVTNEFNNNGYGEWLKNKDEELNVENINNMETLNKIMEEKKEKLRETRINNYNKINEFNNSGYCDLTNSLPQSYASDIFSSLQFEDLKIAHEESIIPVNSKDFKVKYKNMEDINFQRQNQDINPLSEFESKEIINSDNLSECNINSQRAYRLYKQEEEIEIANKKWWGSLRQLK